MSDLSLYELEDIIWDEFDRADDHIVPHPTNTRTSRNSSERDTCKKLRRETTPPVLSNSRNHFDAFCQKKAEKDPKKIKIKTMEKESPPPHGVFNGSCDGEIVKDMPNLASDDFRMPDECYATSATCDNNNSYSYTLSQAEDLCFVDNNNCEDKESGDLLYYGWPDIGNFEDVDKMLRSCDSSFGVGENDGELGWFTSSDQMEGTLKMDFKFPCPEPSGLKNLLKPEHESSESNNHRSSCISETKDEFRFKDHQINSCYPNQTATVSVLSGIKSEHKGVKSPSTIGSSNQSCGETDEQQGSTRQMGKMMMMMFQSSKVCDEKQSNPISQRDIEGLLNVQESSSISSELDEISLEATSFRQLRQVMGQLDMRTKLCIRDSLYRLARSAEQRHNKPGLSHLGGSLILETTNKCSGFMDMETDTNPIDRSVAHLLFHRPSESHTPNPNPNHGSILAERLVCEEEAAGRS